MVSWEIIYKATVFIAEEMGAALKRSSFSPNIRERLDYSCGIVDSEGNIVAQAEHIPVHLGSFKVGVNNILKWIKDNDIELKEGDMVAVNDPYISGTHLNDLMILAPVHYNNKIVSYVINKAHHVDIGGPLPASLNPEAKTLYEEGLIIPPVKIVKEGLINSDVVRIIKENSKTPKVIIGDLYSQIASNKLGIKRVLELIEKYNLNNVIEGWNKSIEYSENLVLYYIKEWKKGYYEAEDYIELFDKDLIIKVKLNINENLIQADFSGSSKQVSYPLNAVYGVTFSSTAYAIRSSLNAEIPTNEGFYRMLEIYAPIGTIVNPKKPAPVSGGNLETSQRIADTVFKALAEVIPNNIPAAGSGTMMNVMLGGYDEEIGFWAYYETIGGGSGGRPNKEGVSCVHVNMTNTLNTPIEVAERDFPIFFTMYKVRENSGGKGMYKGGDGIVRAFKVLKSSKLSILSDRFRRGPWGLKGGEEGKHGRVLIKKSNKIIEMPSKFTIDLDKDDEVIIETPGGGGFGKI